MMYGLTTATIHAIQEVFAKHPDVEKAILYGSRAKGNYRPGSDIDLTLTGEKLSLSTLQKIENELDDLFLPYKIDLSVFQHIGNPDLMAHIERVGQVFYQKEKGMREWKATDIGQIPKHWNLMTVDDIKASSKKSIISGPFGSSISAKYFVESGVPVIRGNNLSLDIHIKFKDDEFVFITDNKAKELGTWAEKDDIIFTAVGTIGQVGILLGKEKYSKYIISNKQLRLRVNTELVEPLYAYYWFASPFMIDMILQRNTGSSVPLINLSVLKSLLIPLPPKEERISILNVLSSLDDKIDLLHRQNATLEKMAEALFRQWFVEEAKEEWESDTLSFFADFFNGKSRPTEVGAIPIYGGNGILGYTNKSNYSGKSIIVGRVGAYCGSLYYENNDIWVSDNALLVKSKIVNSTHFLFFLLKTLELNSMAEGSSHPLLTQTLLKSIEVQIPPIQKINEFDSIVEGIQSKIDSNQTQIRTLTTLRDTLLPKLMSGEVKINL